MLSKACEYSIRATIYIANQKSKNLRASLTDIAEEIDSPKAYTAKLLQKLTQHKIINSIQGAYGGFTIDDKKINSLNLEDIVLAVDGSGIYDNCFMGLKSCSDSKPCPIHSQYKHVRARIREILSSTTILSASNNLSDGGVFLKLEL